MRLATLVLAASAALGCETQAADLREWQPGDHDHTEAPGRDQVDVSDGGSQNPLAAHGISDVVLVAWRQKCVRCHGTIGRGDGPQAPMYSPPDLSDSERQAQLTDQDITQTILRGRGKMPAFDLPESTLEGLTKLIRLIGARSEPAPAGSASAPGTATPPASASGAPPAATPPRGAASAPPPQTAAPPQPKAPEGEPAPAPP